MVVEVLPLIRYLLPIVLFHGFCLGIAYLIVEVKAWFSFILQIFLQYGMHYCLVNNIDRICFITPKACTIGSMATNEVNLPLALIPSVMLLVGLAEFETFFLERVPRWYCLYMFHFQISSSN